jgi:hypothetical protein
MKNEAFGTPKILFVTPATPGFFVLSPVYEANGEICEASREPVVAWAVDALGSNTPITPQEVLNADDDHAILCPDGRVRTYDGEWSSLADWLSERAILAGKGLI